MNSRHVLGASVLVVAAFAAPVRVARGQCCLTDLFAGCGACFRKAPVYAVAPVAAPVVAPVAAPVAAPPPPVMVPVQQVSYVPETTYRTQYQNVPVTTYKPSCEIDPCTGCPVECMQPVTQYVQQAVNVPVTQYRAVTTTKYVQMQPGYAPGAYGAPALPGMPAAAPTAPAASPFAAPVQTTPQGWGAAGADVPQLPGVNAPALPPATYPAPAAPPPTYTQPITPQAGYAPIQPAPGQPAAGQPQPTQPPALAPAPSLKPIPEMPRGGAPADAGTTGAAGTGTATPKPSEPSSPSAPAAAPAGVPAVPGSATGGFPRLLDSGSHTTSWQPMHATPVATAAAWRPSYPTAALPTRLQQ